jgi:hypothetical protein
MKRGVSIKHLIIPDCQVKPGVPLDHLTWAGKYAAEKRPDKIICIGDFADLPSLSSYDIGKKTFEGRTYKADVECAKEAMGLLLSPIQRAIKQSRNTKKPWNPKFELYLGNHEHRIERAIEADRKLDGTISVSDLGYRDMGWNVHPYLEVCVLDGIAYSHYFTSGVLGRPVASARALLVKKHMSCVMGHVQKTDIAYDNRADGKRITGLFCGTFYQHDEQYLGPQGNRHWRGIWMLHNVKDGEFDEMPVPLHYLKEKYK